MYSVIYSRTNIYLFFLFTELCILTELWLDYGQIFNECCILRYGAYQRETLIRGHTYSDPSASSAVLIKRVTLIWLPVLIRGSMVYIY